MKWAGTVGKRVEIVGKRAGLDGWMLSCFFCLVPLLVRQSEPGPDFVLGERDIELLLKLLVEMKVTITASPYILPVAFISLTSTLNLSSLASLSHHTLALSLVSFLSLPQFLLSRRILNLFYLLLSPVQHPNILSPISATFNGTGLMVVRDFCSAGSLRDKIYQVDLS